MVDQETAIDPMTTDLSHAVGTAPVPKLATCPEPSVQTGDTREGELPSLLDTPPDALEDPPTNHWNSWLPSPAPTPPPSITAPLDAVLIWITKVVNMGGIPDNIDISITTRQIDVAVPSPDIFDRWQTILGAVAQPTRPDALGATIFATTVYPGLWSVTIHAHVRPTS